MLLDLGGTESAEVATDIEFLGYLPHLLAHYSGMYITIEFLNEDDHYRGGSCV